MSEAFEYGSVFIHCFPGLEMVAGALLVSVVFLVAVVFLVVLVAVDVPLCFCFFLEPFSREGGAGRLALVVLDVSATGSAPCS